MIKFSLLCARGHEFQSWFQSGEAFEAQAKSGLVLCPLCQAAEVTKAIMAPAIASRGSASGATPQAHPQSQPNALLPGRHVAEMRETIEAFRNRVFENAEDVGMRFADEARNIHDGLAPMRPIHGRASFDDARALIEEGVAILPVPPLPEEYN